jgi:hypothetical protein
MIYDGIPLGESCKKYIVEYPAASCKLYGSNTSSISVAPEHLKIYAVTKLSVAEFS